jgi:tetratricopeptide (TPR) repeat protein
MILRVASGFLHLLCVDSFARGQKVAYIQTDRAAFTSRPSPSMDLPLMRFKRYCVQSLIWEHIVSAMFVAAFSLVLGLTPARPVAGQVLIPAESLSQEAGWQEVLQRGHELEAQQRWGEALAHYEGALRDFPDQRDLWERLSRARSHFDLARRYEDRSYLLSLRSLDEAKALTLYEEILAKIESHYVNPPNWQQLAERGLANLDIALARASSGARIRSKRMTRPSRRFNKTSIVVWRSPSCRLGNRLAKWPATLPESLRSS